MPRITEIGAVKLRDLEIVDKFGMLVDPEREISARITELTGIRNEDVAGQPKEAEALRDMALAAYPLKDVKIYPMRGIATFYANVGGLVVAL